MTGRPLRVGVDATSWSNDRGFGRFTRELLIALAARDEGFHYTYVFDQLPEDALPAGIDVLCASATRSLNEASSGDNARPIGDLLRLGRLAASGRFDVFFFPGVFSYFPILSRVPKVICYHDATAERFGALLFPTRLNHRLWQAKTWLARFQTTRAMTISQASAADLEEVHGFAKDRIDLVTEGPDPCFRVLDDPAIARAARLRHGFDPDADLLVFVGGMNRHKNIQGLLQAMEHVLVARPNTQLALVGSTTGEGFWDNVPELQAYVRDHAPLAEHVRFTGRLSDEDLVELLNGAAALVLPSLWEGFGLPVVEAMACGVPSLSSDRGSLPEVVGDSGLLYDPERPDEIAKTILRFLSDPELRRDLAKRALARAPVFTWERGAVLAEESFRKAYASKG